MQGSANQMAWEYIREAVTAADSTGLLTTTNSNWGARPLTRGKSIYPGAVAVLIAFIGDHVTDPEDRTATVKLTAHRSGGPAQVIQSFDIIIGGQKVLKKPGRTAANATAKWAESIVPNATDPASYWISQPEIVGVLADNVACIALKTYGAAWITAEITVLGTGLILDVLMAPIGELP
jgi:hypothetical protein